MNLNEMCGCLFALLIALPGAYGAMKIADMYFFSLAIVWICGIVGFCLFFVLGVVIAIVASRIAIN